MTVPKISASPTAQCLIQSLFHPAALRVLERPSGVEWDVGYESSRSGESLRSPLSHSPSVLGTHISEEEMLRGRDAWPGNWGLGSVHLVTRVRCSATDDVSRLHCLPPFYPFSTPLSCDTCGCGVRGRAHHWLGVDF